MTPTESAVVVTVPAAERVVGQLRSRFDVAAGWGVPAHVTVLYPFVPPARLDDEVLVRLAGAVARVPAFDCRFERCARFGDDVLWLAPEPDRPFRDLTAAVSAKFPEHQPYGGVFDDVVPHLTVAESTLASVDELRAAEATVSAGLPVPTRVEAVQVMTGALLPNTWRVVHEITLG